MQNHCLERFQKYPKVKYSYMQEPSKSTVRYTVLVWGERCALQSGKLDGSNFTTV
jgi:hypothetical protein